jgi:hypothetical protein
VKKGRPEANSLNAERRRMNQRLAISVAARRHTQTCEDASWVGLYGTQASNRICGTTQRLIANCTRQLIDQSRRERLMQCKHGQQQHPSQGDDGKPSWGTGQKPWPHKNLKQEITAWSVCPHADAPNLLRTSWVGLHGSDPPRRGVEGVKKGKPEANSLNAEPTANHQCGRMQTHPNLQRC